MKKKVLTGICVLLAILFLIPIPMRLKDGGTVVYNAILYRVEDVHRLDPEAASAEDYLEGTIVKILGMEVYNDVEKTDRTDPSAAADVEETPPQETAPQEPAEPEPTPQEPTEPEPTPSETPADEPPAEPERVTEVSPGLEPLSNGGAWTCAAIYGENGNTGTAWGGNIQAWEDGTVYFVFGSTRGKYDNSIDRYVTYRVTVENGSIVSCEEAENSIAAFLNGTASVYRGDFFARGNAEIRTKARYTTDPYNAYLNVYTIQIEGDAIRIHAYADGTDMGGQYTGTYEYDSETGELILQLTCHFFSDENNGSNQKEIGQVRGKLYESNGLAAFVCTDAGEAIIDEGMPLIFVKD